VATSLSLNLVVKTPVLVTQRAGQGGGVQSVNERHWKEVGRTQVHNEGGALMPQRGRLGVGKKKCRRHRSSMGEKKKSPAAII